MNFVYKGIHVIYDGKIVGRVCTFDPLKYEERAAMVLMEIGEEHMPDDFNRAFDLQGFSIQGTKVELGTLFKGCGWGIPGQFTNGITWGANGYYTSVSGVLSWEEES